MGLATELNKFAYHPLPSPSLGPEVLQSEGIARDLKHRMLSIYNSQELGGAGFLGCKNFFASFNKQPKCVLARDRQSLEAREALPQLPRPHTHPHSCAQWGAGGFATLRPGLR